MTQATTEGVTLPSVGFVADSLPALVDDYELLRVLVIGSHRGVNSTIHTLYVLGFAQVNEWSPLLPAPNSGDVMRILTRRIRCDRF